MKKWMILVMVFCLLLINLDNNSSLGQDTIIYKVKIMVGVNVGGIAEWRCAENFTEFIKRDKSELQIETEDVILYENIFYVIDSMNVRPIRNNNLIQNNCVDFALIISRNEKLDTVLLNKSDTWIKVNNNYYLDTNKIVMQSLMFHLPRYILRGLGKKCFCE